MKFLLTFLVALLALQSASAEIIPMTRRPTWTGNAGVIGGIPNVTTKYTEVGPGASGAVIQNALTLCPSNQYVLIKGANPIGGARIRLYQPNGAVGRGETNSIGRPTSSITGNGQDIFAIGSSPFESAWPAATLVSGSISEGASTATVASVANLDVGRLAVLEMDNVQDVVYGYGNAGGGGANNHAGRLRDLNRVQFQIIKVLSIVGNTITFDPPALVGFPSNRNPQIAGFGDNNYGPTRFGLENLIIDGSSGNNGIDLEGCSEMWMRNVEVKGYMRWGLQAWFLHRFEMTGCYYHDPRGPFTVGSGYAFEPNHSTSALIYDNIFFRNQIDVIFQMACIGNVVAYNYLFDNRYNNWADGYAEASIYPNHTPYPNRDLWMGNMGNSVQMDMYYGPGGQMTFFRNFIHIGNPFQQINNIGFKIDSHQWSNNLVGNIIGSSGTAADKLAVLPNVNIHWSNQVSRLGTFVLGKADTADFSYSTPKIFRLGYPYSGNNSSSGSASPPTQNQFTLVDNTVRSNLLDHLNWDAATLTIRTDPAIVDVTLPDDLFWPSKPAWWGDLAWPPFNPTNAPYAVTVAVIPAAYRFWYGSNYVSGVTPTPPTAPSGLAAAAVSVSQINLTWTDNASTESGFKLFRATAAQGPFTHVASPAVNETSYSDTPLAASTTYWYYLVAWNADGDSTATSTVSATTASAAPAAAGTPANPIMFRRR